MAKKDNAAKTGKKKASGMALILVFAPLALLFIPYTLLLVCGMLPSIVAFIADREKQKLTALTVGSLNFAATMPLLVSLWAKGGDMESVSQILSNPINWLLMFCGAGAGWVLVLIVPQLITGVIILREKRRLIDIRRRQQELVDEWGQEVSDAEAKARSF